MAQKEHAKSRGVVAKVWLLVAVFTASSGCMQDRPVDVETCPDGSPMEAGCPAPAVTAPSPVIIDDGGSMLQGVDREWMWTVEPGSVRFSISVEAKLSGGAPAYAVVDYEVQLFQDQSLVATAGAPNGFRTGNPGPLCMLCWEAPAGDDGFPAADNVGDWTLKLRTGPNVDDYTANVAVLYPA